MTEVDKLKSRIRELESDLAYSEDRFHLLFDGIDDAVIMFEVGEDGSRGRIRDVNVAACNRYGYSQEEFLRLTVDDIDAPEAVMSRPTLLERFSSKATALFEMTHRTKDGTRVPVEVSARKFDYQGQPTILSIVRDITARKERENFRERYLKELEAEVEERTHSLRLEVREREQAEKRIRQADINFKALLDATSQSIMLLEADGTIIHVNKVVTDSFGVKPEDVIGSCAYDYLSPDLARGRRDKIRQVVEGRKTLVFQDERDGRQYVSTLYPIVEEGEVVRIAVYAEDVSESFQRESMLDRINHVKSVLYEIINQFHNLEGLDELFKSIHQIMVRELRADNFYVALIDEENDTLEFPYCIDKTITDVPRIMNISDPGNIRLSLLPIRQNQTLQLTRADLEEMGRKGEVSVYGAMPEVWLGVPLRVRGRTIGVMVIQDYDSQELFTSEEMRMVTACSYQFALAIERKKYDDMSEFVRDIFHNSPSGVIICQFLEPESFTVIDGNPAVEKMSGESICKWRGRELEDIWPGATEEGVRESFLTTIRTGEIQELDHAKYEGDRLKGVYHIRTFALPGNRLGAAFEDVTEQKRTEAEIREREEQYRAFFEDNQSVMHVVDPETALIMDTNKAAVHYYGWSREELRKMTVFDLNAVPQFNVQDILRKVRQKKLSQVRTKHGMSNGEIRDVEVFAGLFEIKGKTMILAIVHDITEQVRRETELAEARDVAEQANKAKGEFLANISHEVRTPLNGIMGMLQLIGITNPNEEQKSYVEIAMQSSRGLLRVLNDVLDFTKVDADKLDLVDEQFEITEITDHCVSLFEVQIREKGLDFKVMIHPDTPSYFRGDQGRIRQILLNLIGNALKFTEEGAIDLEVFAMSHTDPNKIRLFFSVTDSGIGIPEDKIAYVFDSFTQVDGSLTRKHQGTGLGLPIARRLVKIMNGSMSVISEVGRGTSVLFFVTVDRTGFAENKSVSGVETGVDSEKLKVLLAEDDSASRIVVQRMLELSGNQVTVVDNGEKCLAELARNEYDIVLMDIQMPVMDGLEATRIIREVEKKRNIEAIPIIALTAHATEDDKQKALAVGMDEYVSKPFEQEDLEAVFANLKKRKN